ncbi:MAG TPA: VWA domain-containing protein [Pyrinomonadaceae bacterium]|nr:VWA domain-containing protein [Pyrinomonadaceae bacterium]
MAQAPTTSRPQQEEVVRVYTDLVQTDVMVFDKEGRFVNGLTKDNFELKIDGKVRPIQSFEQITAGSRDEETQLAAARGRTVNTTGSTPKRVVPLDRGRTVFFYVDDFHLDASGFNAARKLITNFIDKQMGQNDSAAIASATGQIGFLQQLTDNRAVLHAALNRLSVRTYTVTDSDRPSMSEYEAMLIDNDEMDVFEYFVSETMRLNRGMTRDQAAGIVNGRAHSILNQAAQFNTNTLGGLERLVRNARELPGRKVLFLLSNGFLIENRRSDTTSRLQRVTSAAGKSGVVIYSIDTRGLATDKGFDASVERNFDPSGRLQRSTQGETFATQDGLNALARDTGGRPIFNTNDFRPGLTEAIKESSVYYLLAWRPDQDQQKSGRFRNIQVSVIGKPELVVRVRKGYFDIEPPANTAKAAPTPNKQAEQNKVVPAKLRETIAAVYPVQEMPILLGLDYYDLADKGPTVQTSIQMPGEFFEFTEQDGKVQAVIDLTGVFFNDKGVPTVSFLERIVTSAPSLEATKGYHRDITYSYPALKLTPGLYQVRVAARDEKSGRVGSAHAWIEVPDLSKKELSTSSLLLGEKTQAMTTNVSVPEDTITPVNLSANHRFRHESNLRFLIFTYNAAPSPTNQQPDIAVQVQVVRDEQPVITAALKRVATEGVPDLARIPYAAEIPLASLNPGRYILQVTLIDRVSKQSAARQTHFDVY